MEVDDDPPLFGDTDSLPGNNTSDTPSASDYLDKVTDSECLRAATQRISEEQNRLSYVERNLIHEEVHGVVHNNTQEESPELLQYSLNQLTVELEKLVQRDWKNNNANESSLSAGFLMSRSDGATNTYVNRPDFRLRFLRTDDFNAGKAAVRLMKFMNLMLEVFGAFALYRPVKLSDFKRSEIKALHSGWLQILPFRDRSGRKIFIFTGELGVQFDPILRVKIEMYMFLAGTRDAESQRTGCVSVVCPGKSSASASYSISTSKEVRYMSYCNRAMAALPVKNIAIHYCIVYNYQRKLSPLERLLFMMIMRAMSPILQRLKIHIGEVTVVRNNLSGYGIPENLVPITDTGAVKTSELKKWVKLQRHIDDIETAGGTVAPFMDCPGSNDVVFRAGSSMTANPGNVIFRSLIESKVQEVLSNANNGMPQKTKEDIAIEIMEQIYDQQNARFLWWDNNSGCWMEFDDMEQIKSKIAITYRDLKLKIKARSNSMQT